MIKRVLTMLLLVGAALLLAGAVGKPAAAQPTPAGPPSLSDLAGLFKRPAVAPVIHRLDGPRTLSLDEEAAFTASANVDVATLPLKSRWRFGDGTEAAGLATRHRFAAPGTYAVVFTLSNDHGTATDTLVVRVEARQKPADEKATVVKD